MKRRENRLYPASDIIEKGGKQPPNPPPTPGSQALPPQPPAAGETATTYEFVFGEFALFHWTRGSTRTTLVVVDYSKVDYVRVVPPNAKTRDTPYILGTQRSSTSAFELYGDDLEAHFAELCRRVIEANTREPG